MANLNSREMLRRMRRKTVVPKHDFIGDVQLQNIQGSYKYRAVTVH